MKAIVFHGVGDIRLENVPEPRIEQPTDAIIRVTAAAICGTDLHMIRGTLPGMKGGTVLGHEGVGVVTAVGDDVRNFSIGDRVVVPSTIACGTCSYCRAGYPAQCDNANPHGNRAGTAYYGGPEVTGSFSGLQAEKARVPFANVNLVKLPPEVSDEAAVLLSDIAPTGWFGAELAHAHPGSTVAVFGCGPVGQFVIASLRIMGVGRILAVDHVPSRLDAARQQGAEVIDYEREDPVATILRLTSNIGVDRAIDAVGVDAERPAKGPAAPSPQQRRASKEELAAMAPEARIDEAPWHAGDAPSLALEWAVDSLAKAGTLAIVGVYPETARTFPIGKAMTKNLTLRMGNCNHRKYIPHLIDLVVSGVLRPMCVLTQEKPFAEALDAYRHFDQRESGWLKVAFTA